MFFLAGLGRSAINFALSFRKDIEEKIAKGSVQK